MSNKKRIVFIINPISGTQKKDDIPPLIGELMDAEKYDIELRRTEYAGHAAEIARQCAAEGADVVVAVGGDGTVNEVARPLTHTETALGIIPCGSGNGLARHLRIPLDVQVGISKRLTAAPLRFHVTLSRLTEWDQSFGRHIALGADLLLGQIVYLAAGYNFRRAYEMKISDSDGSSAHGAGLSLGAGLQLERFKLQIGYGKYHVSASSLLINISYAL